MVYIIPAICTGIMMVLYSPLSSGKEVTLGLMDGALKETIMTDYHSNSPLSFELTNKTQVKSCEFIMLRIGTSFIEYAGFLAPQEEACAQVNVPSFFIL